ncbi:MAG TPA: glycosyltransferase family 4 protein [Kiloniellaceae bacterium]|nr:glycosyltransferase family 4 protein [Kiloniellaceae bacterium]
MRILIVAPEPFYEDRGTPIALRHVVEALSRLDHQVDILTYPIGEPVELPGITINRVGQWLPIKHVPIGFSLRKAGLDLLLLPRLFRMLQKNRYDVIHAVEESAFLAMPAARVFKVPLLYDMQSSLPEQLKDHPILGSSLSHPALQWFERWLLRNVDGVACSIGLENFVRDKAPDVPVIEWHYPFQSDPFEVTGVEAIRARLNIPKDAFVILYTGNFEEYQGVRLVAQAIPQVLAAIPQAVFLFVGVKRDETGAKLGVSDKIARSVRIVERRPRAEMPSFLSLADVLLLPRNPIQNLPLKVLDYMASGKPIVASDSPAHRTVLTERSALLVERTATAFAAAILRLHADPTLAQAIAQEARTAVEERFGLTAFSREIGALYPALAGCRKG